MTIEISEKLANSILAICQEVQPTRIPEGDLTTTACRRCGSEIVTNIRSVGAAELCLVCQELLRLRAAERLLVEVLELIENRENNA